MYMIKKLSITTHARLFTIYFFPIDQFLFILRIFFLLVFLIQKNKNIQTV